MIDRYIDIYEDKYTFTNKSNDELVSWSSEFYKNPSKGFNCVDFSLFIAQLAIKDNKTVILAKVGCVQRERGKIKKNYHIIPMILEDNGWEIVNYVGDDPTSRIYNYGSDDITETLDSFARDFIPDLIEHNNLNPELSKAEVYYTGPEALLLTLRECNNTKIKQKDLLNILFS